MLTEQLQPKVLAQLRPSGTSAVAILSPTESFQIVDSIFVTHVAGGNETYSLFLDIDGTTYDQSTALVWNKQLADFEILYDFRPLIVPVNGNLAVQTDTADAFNFTVLGRIRT